MLDPSVVFNLERLEANCKTLTAINIAEAATEFIEKYDGEIKNVKNNSDWLRLFKAVSIKRSIQARELDNCALSNKYGTTINFGLEWDKDLGVRVETESLGKQSIINK